MATLLHQQLKELYVPDASRHEVSTGAYRADAIDAEGRVIEVQCASLAAIRSKIKTLTRSYDVTVVKPLASRTRIVKKLRKGGKEISSRFSPKRETLFDLFYDLVHFRGAFPLPRLRLDLVFVQQEEIRLPPSRRSSWRKKYRVEDRMLIDVDRTVTVESAADLWSAIGASVSGEFTTAELAKSIGEPRWMAQKVAYCFRHMGFLNVAGKHGNSIVYSVSEEKPKRKRTRKRAA